MRSKSERSEQGLEGVPRGKIPLSVLLELNLKVVERTVRYE